MDDPKNIAPSLEEHEAILWKLGEILFAQDRTHAEVARELRAFASERGLPAAFGGWVADSL